MSTVMGKRGLPKRQIFVLGKAIGMGKEQAESPLMTVGEVARLFRKNRAHAPRLAAEGMAQARAGGASRLLPALRHRAAAPVEQSGISVPCELGFRTAGWSSAAKGIRSLKTYTADRDRVPSEGDAGTDPLLTLREVAERVGRTQRTIRRWRRDGLLPAVKIAGTVRVRLSDLERALQPDQGSNLPKSHK